MLPTIDISLIGVFLAVFNVIKIIWDYVSKAFMWIMHQALALLIGSKFWATAAFLAAGLIIIHYLSQILVFAANELFSLASPGEGLNDSELFKVIDFFFSIDQVTNTVVYCLSCWVTYRLIVSMDFTRRVIQRTFSILSKSWKT